MRAATTDGLRQRWANIAARIEALRAAELVCRAGGSRGEPPHIQVEPPATEAEVRATEAVIGRRLPTSLRRFFLEASAGLTVLWSLPGTYHVAGGGWGDVRYSRAPPPPLSRERSGELQPEITGGAVRLGLAPLAELPGNWETDWLVWLREIEDEAQAAIEAAHPIYTHRHARLWGRAFPFATNTSGDVLAIDLTDPAERLILLNHEGGDELGWFLGQSLIDHLDEQSRLACPGFEGHLLELFRDEARSAEAARGYEAEAGRTGLAPPPSLVIGADTFNGRLWRSFLGLAE